MLKYSDLKDKHSDLCNEGLAKAEVRGWDQNCPACLEWHAEMKAQREKMEARWGK